LVAGAACADVGLGAKGSWVTNRQTDNTMGMVGGFVRVGAPMLAVEAGVDYRSEGIENDLNVKTWPVTVGLVLSPIPLVYAVAGVGWYHTTIDFPTQSPFRDETSTAFGYHAGAGLKIPVAPMVSAIADVRYSYVNYKFDEFADALGDFKKGNFVSLNAGLMFSLPASKRS
jgi:opacity protein-like surface antigen